MSAAVTVPHQCGTVSRRLIPRRNFPTDKKAIPGWRDASKNPTIWEKFGPDSSLSLTDGRRETKAQREAASSSKSHSESWEKEPRER